MRYCIFEYGVGTRYDTPVFIVDRTVADVERRTDKAYINASDLNRIEYRIGEIQDMLAAIGYDALQLTVSPFWGREDLLHDADMERIRSNVEALVAAYNHNIGQPVIPHNLRPGVFDINALEETLELLDNHIKRVAHQWNQYSGATIAGGGVL